MGSVEERRRDGNVNIALMYEILNKRHGVVVSLDHSI